MASIDLASAARSTLWKGITGAWGTDPVEDVTRCRRNQLFAAVQGAGVYVDIAPIAYGIPNW